ncbi:MAG TPA: cytochrome c oxidase assembly protein [Iamia sp.]|nr:cytochrome c oxidase assembly protein [Iamia sp.]
MVALAAPSATTLLRPAPDPAFLLLLVLLVAGHVGLVRRRRAAHPDRTWPAGRSWAFGLGVATLAIATQSGLARYDTALFSLHMVQHLLLGMVAPLLLALGAPVTLLLQGAPRGVQVGLLRILDHPVARALTHPIVAWSLFSLSLFALYFTPLLDLSLRHDLVHVAVHLHFVAAGFLFCWSVLGVDPGRRRTGPAARLLAVALTIPLHALLGLAIQSGADDPLGAEEYGRVVRTWGGSLAADQRTAAGVLWGLGELWGVILVIVVAVGWMQAEERRQAREDARLDRQRGGSTAASASSASVGTSDPGTTSRR